MVDAKITALTELAATPEGTDIVPIVDDPGGSPVTKKITVANLTGGCAVAAKGVTNGDSHDHSGGDGAQINHTTLSNIGTTTHADLDTDHSKLAGIDTGADVTADNDHKSHKASHQSGGADAIQIDNLAAGDDNTDLDVSTSKHGLCPKAPNDTSKILRGDGAFNYPAFLGARAYLSGDQDNIASGGANVYKINLNAESYDIGTDFDTANYRYVAPVTGYYQVNATVTLEGADMTAAQVGQALIFVNGSVYSNGSAPYATANGQQIASCVSDVVYITAGQYIELYAYVSDTNVDIESGATTTFMSIAFLGV